MTQQIINIGASPNDGDGDNLRTAFDKVNENFTAIWDQGPVDSNVSISGNTISTTTVNTDLALSPNGVGNIKLNNNTVPGANNTWYLGSTSNRWRGLYVGNVVAGNISVTELVDFSGDVTIGGNLTVEGDTIQIGNITTDTKTIQLSNTASTTTAANGSGVTVGANDNIATILYNSTSNTWNTNIGISSTGNITAPYFIGNGALLTGISSTYGNANVATLLASFGSNTISTTGNVTAGYFIGNGSQLTGITSYANANAVAYGQAGWAGNIIPATSNVYSLGNSTNQWSDLYVSNATIYMNNVPISLTAGNVLTVDGEDVVVTTANGTVNLGNLTVNDYNIYNAAGQGVIISNFSFVDEAETAYVQIPAGNSTNDLNVVQEQGNVRLVANTAVWNFGTDGKLTAPGDIITETAVFFDDGYGNLIGAVGGQGANNIGFNSYAGNGVVISTDDETHYWYFGADGKLTAPGEVYGQYFNIRGGGGAGSSVGNLGYSGSDVSLDAAANITLNTSGVEGGPQWKFDTNGTLTVPGDITSNETLAISSGDDINISGGNKVPGSASSEGGDITIFGGTGRPDSGTSVGSGGDVRINAGDGGDGSLSGAGAGGYAEVQGGSGGAANVVNNIQAGEGGYVIIQGGQGGDNQGNLALSGIGGNVDIYGGAGSFDDANSVPSGAAGHVNLYGGNWGWVTPSGNIYLNTYDGSNFKTLTYDNTGNLSVPQNINFSGGGIQQVLNEDFYVRVSDDEDEGWSIYNVVDDGAGTALTRTRIDSDGFYVQTDMAGSNYQWNFNGYQGITNFPGNLQGTYGGDTSFYAYDNGSGGMVEMKTISYIGDQLLANVTVRHPNVTISTQNSAYTWTFDGYGNLILPPSGNIVGDTANNSGHLSWFGNSSGDNNGYTTMRLVPDDTREFFDQYLIIDPTAPGHIHIRAGGTQDNSNADLILGGENSYFKVPAGANSEVRISANSHAWVFGADSTLYVPGEGVIRSIQDTVILQSVDALDKTYSARLGTTGGLYFETSDYPLGWLSLTNESGNANIVAGAAASGQGGRDLYINAGASDSITWNSNSGGNVEIYGGYGSFADGGGGPGGDVSIYGGFSSDSHPGNVYIQGPNYWNFDYTGDLTGPGDITTSGNIATDWLNIGNVGNIARLEADVLLQITTNATSNTAPSWTFGTDGTLFVPGNIAGDNIGPLIIDGNGSGIEGYISLPASNFGGEQIFIVNEFTFGNGISLVTNGGEWHFGNSGAFTAPGNITTTANISGGYILGNAAFMTGIPASYGNANVADFLDSLGSNAIITTGNISGGNLNATTGNFSGNVTAANFSGNISITGNVTGTSPNVSLVAGSYTYTFDNTGVLSLPAVGGDEGGEIKFGIPTANTTLTDSVKVDVYRNQLRFFDGSTNGAYLDIANCPSGISAAVGYRDIPQISFSANATATGNAAGCHYYSTTAGNLQLTIPDNANVAFPTGATLTIVMNAAGNVIVAQGTGVTLYMAGSSTTGNRTVGAYGLASVMKVAANTWIISGTGVY